MQFCDMKTEMMKTVYYERYGGPEVLHIREEPIPVCGPDEVLVRIHTTAVNSGDIRLRKADPWAVRLFFGLFKPKKQILGGVFSGEIIQTGSQVSRFEAGDKVFGSTGLKLGTYAEYCLVKANGILVKKPINLTHETAVSLVFGSLTALHFLRKADLKPGHKVLIYGASGAVGSAAVQWAHLSGAQVTAVCSTRHTSLMNELGAVEVLNYDQPDWEKALTDYDVIMEAVNKFSYKVLLKRLKQGGSLILVAADVDTMFRVSFGFCRRKKILKGVIQEKLENLNQIAAFASQETFLPVIDRIYDLAEIREAHRYVEQGHKQGNVIIRLL